MDNNILLIDKPSGITSFDVIRILRKKMGIRKMGHAGTLDPMATGLMIIGIESGTKKLKDFLKLDKTYETEILLGVKTDTGDLEGKIIEQQEIAKVSDEKITQVLNDMVGEIELPVPKYSAIKKHGKPLYKYAREGKDIDIPIKRMKINWMKILSSPTPIRYLSNIDSRLCGKDKLKSFRILLNVSSGTYIRSIAEEIGRRLDTVATLSQLRRITIGPYLVEDAESLN